MLQGLTILNSRAQHQLAAFTEQLQAAGATVIEHPAISIGSCSDEPNRRDIDETLASIGEFNTFVFVSSNGVRFFVRELLSKAMRDELMSIQDAVAIGAATAQTAKSFDIDCQTPETANSDSLAQWLIEFRHDRHLLILRANRGSDILGRLLREAGVRFKELVVYESTDVTELHPEVKQILIDGEIDWLPFASSATAKSFLALLKPISPKLKRAPRIASISPTTSQAIRELGFEVDAEATRYNLAGLIEAMASAGSD